MSDSVASQRTETPRRDTAGGTASIRKLPPWVLVEAGILTAGLGTYAGLGLTGWVAKPAVVISLGVSLGALLATLAAVRFEAFILTLLAIRSILDFAKTTSAGASIADPASLVALLMIGASSVWLMSNRRSHTPSTSLSIGVSMLIVVAGLSTIGASNVSTSLAEFLRILSGVLMFLVIDRLLVTGTPFRSILVALYAATLVPLLLPLVGLVTDMDLTHQKGGVEALKSTFFLSNNFAHFLVPFLVIGYAVRPYLSGLIRWALAGGLVVGLVELILTQTRGAWVASMVGVIVVSVIEKRATIFGVLLAAALTITLVPSVNQRLLDLSPDPDSPRAESSWTWRVEHWAEIISLPDGHRLTGIGLGMTLETSWNQKDPHNDYVLAYVEMGLLGLGAYLVLMGSFVYRSFRALRNPKSGFERGVTAGIAAYAVAFALASFAENLLTSVAALWYMMPLAAMANWFADRSREPALVRPFTSDDLEVERDTDSSEESL